MVKDSIELRLIEKILELKDGEYSVNTSKGNFIVKRKTDKKEKYYHETTIDNIIIERENKTIFGEYQLEAKYEDEKPLFVFLERLN